jgi:hypothetical protein
MLVPAYIQQIMALQRRECHIKMCLSSPFSETESFQLRGTSAPSYQAEIDDGRWGRIPSSGDVLDDDDPLVIA